MWVLHLVVSETFCPEVLIKCRFKYITVIPGHTHTYSFVKWFRLDLFLLMNICE